MNSFGWLCRSLVLPINRPWLLLQVCVPSASQPIYELLKVTLSKALERMAAAGPDDDKPYNIAIIVPSDAVPNEPLYHVTRTGQANSLHLPAGVQSDSIVNMARNVDTLEWEFKTRSNRSDEGDWTLL